MRSFGLVFSFCWLISLSTQAGNHDYIQDVTSERQEHFSEVFLFAEPKPQIRPLQDLIFNAELSLEFRSKYRDRFGQIDTDSISYQRTDFERLEVNKGYVREVETQNSNRRAFAEYMTKRLMEWHVDHYIQSEPTMRPLYEVKEKLKKVEVHVTKETKIEARYSLAGNTLDLIMNNSLCDSKMAIEMDPGAFGPAPIQNTKLILSRPLSTTLRTENTWTALDARTKIELIKSHTPRLASSYAMSAAYRESRVSGESRADLGMTYSF